MTAAEGRATAEQDDGPALFNTVPRAATMAGIDVRTLRAGLERGEIPGFKVGRRWRVSTAWIRAQAGLSAGRGAA